MAQEHDPGSSPSVRVGRWAAVVVAAGAASASALAVGGAAGASTSGSKVTVVKTSSGKVLSDGGTVYTLKPSSTKCTSACLVVWPAVVLPSGVKHTDGGFRCHRVQARDGDGARRRCPGDLRRQAAVPVLRRQRTRSGERQCVGRMG